MKINITNKQYEVLIRSLEIASWVYGTLDDNVESKDISKNSKAIEAFRQHCMSYFKDFDGQGLVEELDTEAYTLYDEFEHEVQSDIDAYEDIIFFQNLALHLGKRDYYEQLTSADLKRIQSNDGWLDSTVFEFYQKYEKEFDKHGVKRLQIVDN